MTPARYTSVPTKDQGLARRVIKGSAWLFGQTIASRLIHLASIVILGRMLGDREFGVLGYVSAVYAFMLSVEHGWMATFLVQRAKRCNSWLPYAGCLGIGLGAGTTALLAVISVFLYLYMDDPTIALGIGLLVPVALISPLSSLSLAVLRTQMAFGSIAIVGFVQTLLTAGLAIALALVGFDAYALIGGLAAGALARPVLLIMLRPPPLPQFHWNRMRLMVLRGANSLFADIVQVAGTAGFPLWLGLFYKVSDIGQYFFAYRLSAEAMRLISVNSAQVMFPAMSAIRTDLNRLASAMRRSLLGVAIPGYICCSIGILLADPFVSVIFGPGWGMATKLLQILLIGWIFRILTGPTLALLYAGGNFRLVLSVRLVLTTVLFTGTALIGWAGGGILEVTWFIAVWGGVLTATWIWFSMQIFVKYGVSGVARPAMRLLGGNIGLLALGYSSMVAFNRLIDVPWIWASIIASIFYILAMIPLLWWLSRRDIYALVKPILKRIKPSNAAL